MCNNVVATLINLPKFNSAKTTIVEIIGLHIRLTEIAIARSPKTLTSQDAETSTRVPTHRDSVVPAVISFLASILNRNVVFSIPES
jgi:hypothetical protein